MAWKHIVAVYTHSKAKGAAFAVLHAIAYHLNKDTDLTWLSEPTILADARLSRRQVQRALYQLESEGELIIEHSRGRGHAQVYRLPPHWIGVTMTPLCEKGDISTEKRRHPVQEKASNPATKGVTLTPLPVVPTDLPSVPDDLEVMSRRTEDEEDWKRRYDQQFGR
jgi:hypothetical protein